MGKVLDAVQAKISKVKDPSEKAKIIREEREKLGLELQASHEDMKTLSGLLVEHEPEQERKTAKGRHRMGADFAIISPEQQATEAKSKK